MIERAGRSYRATAGTQNVDSLDGLGGDLTDSFNHENLIRTPFVWQLRG